VAHEIALRVTRQLEDATPGGEDAAGLIADDEPGRGRRVVVVHQLEEKAEPAPATADGRRVEQALPPIVVDRPLLAIGADEVGHRALALACPTASACGGSTRPGGPSTRGSTPTTTSSRTPSAARVCVGSSGRRARR